MGTPSPRIDYRPYAQVTFGEVGVPTVLVSGPYRFFYYMADSAEPAHVHVERDGAEAKFWLDPVSVGRSFQARGTPTDSADS